MMKQAQMHKIWRLIAVFVSVVLLLNVSACAWIEEFDSRYDTVIVEPSRDPIRVAWVNSYTESTIWSIRVQTGILETLARSGYSRPVNNLEWRAFHLNAKGDESFALLRYRAQAMIPDIIAYDPDIIIVSDDEAALTIAPLYPDLDVPIVYCGVTTDLQVTGLMQPNIVGVTEPIFAEETLAIARTMVPLQRKNLILAEESMTGKASANSVLAELAGADNQEQIPVVELVRDWEEWKQVVQAYTGEVDLIFIASYHPLPDRDGNLVSEKEMMSWTLHNSRAPVFAFTQTIVANGAVAGLVTDGYNQGRYAAEIVAYLADGGDVTMVESDLSIEQTHRLVLNLAAAKRWSLTVPVMLPIAAEVYAYEEQSGGGQ